MLYEGQFLVFYFAGHQLLIHLSYTIEFTQGIPQAICAQKPTPHEKMKQELSLVSFEAELATAITRAGETLSTTW